MSNVKEYTTDVDQSGVSETGYFKSKDGESLAFTIGHNGLVTIWSEKANRSTTLDSIVISGFTQKQASKKSKGFWGGLWDKIKKVVNDIIDAVTFPAGPLTCRPTGQVGFQNSKLISLGIGISCR